MSASGFHKHLFLGNDHLQASFFLNGLIFFGLMIIKDFLDLCWIRTLISEHVFNMDLDNYLVDEVRVNSIRQDISEIRKIQIEHAVDVDTKDPHIAVLFDEEFSEERIAKFERKRLRRLARGDPDENDEEGTQIKQKKSKKKDSPDTLPQVELVPPTTKDPENPPSV